MLFNPLDGIVHLFNQEGGFSAPLGFGARES